MTVLADSLPGPTGLIPWLRKVGASLVGPASLRELRALPASERRRVLADIAVTEAELPHLYRGARHAQELLPPMMQRFGLDPELVRRQRTAVFRDLQRLCSKCTQTRHCAQAVRAGAGASECRRFCPNAATLDKLTEERVA